MNETQADPSKSVSIHCSGDSKEDHESFTKFGQSIINMTMPSYILSKIMKYIVR